MVEVVDVEMHFEVCLEGLDVAVRGGEEATNDREGANEGGKVGERAEPVE